MNRFTLRAGSVVSRPTLVRAGALAASAALATSLAACGGSGSPANASSSTDTVTIGENADAAPNGYDPLLYSAGQFNFFAGLYDALFVTDAQGAVTPSLVSSFTDSADHRTLTLKLRQGVTFTDGSTLDSALVKQNLDRRSDKTLAAYGQIAPTGSSAITSIATPDAQTVVITWATPQAMGANNLADEAGVIVGKQGLANPDSLKTTPDGSGPYTLSSSGTTRGSSYTLTKNAKAWNAKTFPYQTVVFKVITDPQALANAVVSGQVDVAGQLDPTTLDVVKSRKSLAQVGGTIVGFPVVDKTGRTNPAFAKPEVRLALSYAIDRETLVKQLHPGDKPTAQLFPSSATGFDPALNQKYAYDPAKAKQLLAQAGYPNGFSIDLTVLGQPTEDEVAVQKQWQQIGVKVNFITATSTDAAFAAAQTQPLLFGPFAVGSNPAGFTAGVVYGGFMNLQHAKDPNIEKALGGALGGSGSAKDAALKDLNAAITDDGWYIPLYESYIYFGYDKSKVAAPALYGNYGEAVLSSIKPAS
jgi:peptide/nickel transport system substrate-binding protein